MKLIVISEMNRNLNNVMNWFEYIVNSWLGTPILKI